MNPQLKTVLIPLPMRALAVLSLILTLVLLALGSYLRLDQSGIGCVDWPGCYGQIGAPEPDTPGIGGTIERLADVMGQPPDWPRRVHRLVAGAIGLLAVGLCVVAVRARRHRLLALAILALVIFLAWLGMYSTGLHSPAVVMGNLLGGFTLAALLGWIVFRDARPRANAGAGVRRWVAAALLLLCLQIALGGLTSANFAATACETLPDCQGTWLPGKDIWTAFDLTRRLEVGPTGLVLGGAERADIHKLHRIVGVLTVLATIVATALALRARLGATAVAVLAIAVLEFGAGAAAIRAELPLGVAVAHNGLAAILMLGLLRLLALCRNRQALL